MKLKNILIVVKDIERSRQFYHDLFGLDRIVDNDGNMILMDGLVLQDEKIWREFLGKDYHMSTQGGKPNVRVSYLLTAWPDYADDGQYVTTIEITDPAVFVYGLTVESEPTEFERVMMSMGYKVELADNSIQRAVRDGFTFSICRGDTPKLVISAEVSNREEICF